MNRYEALGAPPSLSSKDMAMHVKMLPQSAISKELRTQYSAELLNPKLRMYDELSTLRFPRPGPAEENADYAEVFRKISHAGGAPIPYRFFKAEYGRLMEECGYSNAKQAQAAALINTIKNIQDPWRYLGYAAQYLRIAENSELDDSANACKPWSEALNAYMKFFAAAKCEDSFSYRAQTEERFRELCREAWDSFLQDALESLYRRMKDYMQRNNAEAVGACMSVLQLPQVKRIAPSLYSRAMDESLIPYTSAIRTAPTLGQAGEMYSKCPAALLKADEKGECRRAMLAAMKSAVEKLKDGGEKTGDIVRWAKELQAQTLYRTGSPLVKKDAEDFFEACAQFIRQVIQNETLSRVKDMELLITIMPPDFVIAKSNDKDMRQADLAGYGVLAYLNDAFSKELKAPYSADKARAFGKKTRGYIDRTLPKGELREKAIGEIMRFVIVQMQQSELITHEMMLAFFEDFPDGWPLDDPQLKTVGAFKANVLGQGSPTGEAGLQMKAVLLIKEAQGAEDCSQEQLKKLNSLIDFLCENPGLSLGENSLLEIVDHILIQAFVAGFNRLEQNGYDSGAKAVAQLAGSFLPPRTALPTGGRNKLNTDELMSYKDLDKLSSYVSRRRNLDTAKPTRPTRPTSPTRPTRPTHGASGGKRRTRLNGVRYRGGKFAAAVQYFLLAAAVTLAVGLAVSALLGRAQPGLYMWALLSLLPALTAVVLGLCGVFGLMCADGSRTRAACFGAFMRWFVVSGAVVFLSEYVSHLPWTDSLLLRLVSGIIRLVWMGLIFRALGRYAYRRSATSSVGGFTFTGGAVAAFFKYLLCSLILPCLVASLIWIFQWRVSAGWSFAFRLYGLLLAFGVLQAFFSACENSGARRFSKAAGTVVKMLNFPAALYYTLYYFDKLPMRWWLIALYIIYGLVCIVIFKAVNSDD